MIPSPRLSFICLCPLPIAYHEGACRLYGRMASAHNVEHEWAGLPQDQRLPPCRRLYSRHHGPRAYRVNNVRQSAEKGLTTLLSGAALWNRNYFLRFWFRLLKSYGSGSGSYFLTSSGSTTLVRWQKVCQKAQMGPEKYGNWWPKINIMLPKVAEEIFNKVTF